MIRTIVARVSAIVPSKSKIRNATYRGSRYPRVGKSGLLKASRIMHYTPWVLCRLAFVQTSLRMGERHCQRPERRMLTISQSPKNEAAANNKELNHCSWAVCWLVEMIAAPIIRAATTVLKARRSRSINGVLNLKQQQTTKPFHY